MFGLTPAIELIRARLREESSEATAWTSRVMDDYLLDLFVTDSGESLIAIGSGGHMARISKATGTVYAAVKVPVGSIFCAVYNPGEDTCWIGTDKGVLEVDKQLRIRFLITEQGWFEQLGTNTDASILMASVGRCLYVLKREVDYYTLILRDNSFPSTISGICCREGTFLVAHYGGLRVYEVANGFSEHVFYPCSTSLLNLSWSQNKKYLCSGTLQNCLHFWPYPFEAGSDFQISGFPARVSSMAWQETGQRLAINCGDAISLWDFRHGPPVGQTPQLLQAGLGKINRVYYRRQLLVATSGNGFIFCFLPHKSSRLRSVRSVDGAISVLAVDGEEERLFIGTEDGEITAFDIDI